MHQHISRLLFRLMLAISVAGSLFAIETGPIVRLSAAPLYSGRTQDPTPVELTMQDRDAVIRFKIPKMYMTFSPNWSGGMQQVVVFEVVFPGMSPAGNRSLASPEALVIGLHSFAHTGADYNISRLLRWSMDNEWTLVGQETDRVGQRYSIYVARANIEKWKNQNASVIEYLIPEDFVGKRTYLECHRERLNPFVGCTCFTTFGENISLEVSFRRSQLEKWREMLRSAEGLLTSFKE